MFLLDSFTLATSCTNSLLLTIHVTSTTFLPISLSFSLFFVLFSNVLSIPPFELCREKIAREKVCKFEAPFEERGIGNQNNVHRRSTSEKLADSKAKVHNDCRFRLVTVHVCSGVILHIRCVVVTNLSVCLFVCQQVACDVVTVFSIGVAVPCQSRQSNRSNRSIDRSVDQSSSHDSLVSLLISHSVSVGACTHLPTLAPLAPLARSGHPLRSQTYTIHYHDTSCFIPTRRPSSRSDKKMKTILERVHPPTSYLHVLFCVHAHRFHVRSPLLGLFHN